MTTDPSSALDRLKAVAPGLTQPDLDDLAALPGDEQLALLAKYQDLGKLPSRDVAQEVVDVLKECAPYVGVALSIATFFGL